MAEMSHESADDKRLAENEMQALYRLGQSFSLAPTLVNAQAVLNHFSNVKDLIALPDYRLAILRSFTLEPVVPLLQAGALSRGMDLDVRVGGFNSYGEEILDPGSQLYRYDPQIAILAIQTRDLLPELWEDRAELNGEGSGLVTKTVRQFETWISAFRSRCSAHLIIHSLEVPAFPAMGALDAQRFDGQSEAIRSINRELKRLAAAEHGVYVLDYDNLVARVGRLNWRDEARWLSIRMPMTAGASVHLAEEYLRYVLALTGRGCKALVVDLDNTLWGGILGEDGPAGIKLGREYPGSAYLALQMAVLTLRERGVILAVCSRNNQDEALDLMRSHEAMLLRPEHFGAMRINWQDKVSNLREIATELNIGIDALAFLDDDPAQRERVRQFLPEVHVIELSNNPATYAASLRAAPVFERLNLSTEDTLRSEHYVAERRRTELRDASGALEEYYRSLEIAVRIAEPDPGSWPRVAELTRKTNQFNLTTRRYSDQQIAEMAADPRQRVYALSAVDRFGDYGLVAVAIVCLGAESWEIDTFLMSCRAMGRGIETALLVHLAHEAAAAGARRLQGWYLPTNKNAPASEFYSRHHFVVKKREGDNVLFEYDLETPMDWPEWIRADAEQTQ